MQGDLQGIEALGLGGLRLWGKLKGSNCFVRDVGRTQIPSEADEVGQCNTLRGESGC